MESTIEHADRVYRNAGNLPLLDLLDGEAGQVLDVGCGAGDNAVLLKARFPTCEVHGVTRSAREAEIAKQRMAACSVLDIEDNIPMEIATMQFDTIIFSHVLEHLRDPAVVVSRFSRLLKIGGTVLIAVPNVLSWSMRWQFLWGDFEYRSEGVLDDTHLRFFTYFTADKYLLENCPELKLASKSVSGGVPLWWLRRYLLPRHASNFIDALGCRFWPNLFGIQVLLKLVNQPSRGCR
jgi:SAM-dependent methyltransferase